MVIDLKLKGQIWICTHCGQPYEPKQKTQKYCSTVCGQLHRKVFVVRIEKICDFCEKSFLAYHKDTEYCSDKCRSEVRNVKKGLKITKDYWRELREFILERDNFTCQDCDAFKMSVGLAVHHIKPMYKGGINKPENCITLCDKCHKRRHRL